MHAQDILNPVIGQRWFAPLEPDLGLGIIQEVDDQRITLLFAGLEEPRIYSRRAQQISRAVFHVGDELTARNDIRFVVTDITVEGGLIIYEGKTADDEIVDVSEILLIGGASYKSPLERILGGLWESKGLFKMRRKALTMHASLMEQDTLGYLGARMEFLPHQISVANAVSEQGYRALLADEVGLGKTIEAGMILQRLVIRRDVKKALIVTPKALSFQWFVEMLRRFNLHFNIIQDEWLNQGVELFDLGQLFIISEELFQDETACNELADIDWDMMVIDEIHHYSPTATANAWTMLKRHSDSGRPMLGLSATPDQGGQQMLFDRLALLAPHFYTDYNAYTSAFNDIESGDSSEQTLASLGFGKHHFRNSRSMMEGFPERNLDGIALPLPEDYDPLELYPEVSESIETDPRTNALVQHIKANKRDKLLVITHNADTCEALEQHLRIQHGYRTADFHEHLDLIERDRAAAYFSDPEGAQILVCSEIGSEGRNFQFCHQLVMFDLPPSVAQLEQRIGRLDRIGQQNSINLTQLYFEDSIQARLFDVYHNGFNAYLTLDSHNSLHEASHSQAIAKYLTGGNTSVASTLASLHSASLSTVESELAKQSMSEEDSDPVLDRLYERDYLSREQMNTWLLDLAQVYNLGVEELGDFRYSLQASTQTDEELVPSIDPEGIEVVCDRTIATANEHLRFYTVEHPWFLDLLDRITTTARGSSWVGKLSLKSVPEGTMMLACNFKTDNGEIDSRLWMGKTALSETITAELLSNAKNVKANMALEWLRGQSAMIEKQLEAVKAELPTNDWQLESLGIIICHQ